MKIKVFGVPRSGGTLVTNLVNEIFEECNQIIPEHNYFTDSDKAVVVYRDFRDCIASYWRAFCANFDEKEFKKSPKFRWISGCLWEYKNLYIPRLNKFKTDWDKENTLFLRYEDFYNDFNFIFDSLENFMDIEIRKDKRFLMAKNFDFKNVKINTKYAENFWDGKLYKGFHGKHLYTGLPQTIRLSLMVLFIQSALMPLMRQVIPLQMYPIHQSLMMQSFLLYLQHHQLPMHM